MRVVMFCLILVVLSTTCSAGQGCEKQQDTKGKPEIAEPNESWEFAESDEMLWLHFRPHEGSTDKCLRRSQMPILVQLAGVDTEFVPLVYLKGSGRERKEQKALNDAIAAFIAQQLRGKRVWIEDAKPAVFAGPRQILAVIWFDPDRTKSLQQLLVEAGFAVKKTQPHDER